MALLSTLPSLQRVRFQADLLGHTDSRCCRRAILNAELLVKQLSEVKANRMQQAESGASRALRALTGVRSVSASGTLYS